jgi:O-acetyl-ADP-ribose deacetylase (regulator of RNase III)
LKGGGKMKFIDGDITEVKRGIICHQVNCQGVMGAGLALQIRRKFPEVYDAYLEAHIQGRLQLGNVIYVNVTPSLTVANICGQNRYGKGKCHTDYEALKKAFKDINLRKFHSRIDVYIPYMLGCGLAGGDWKVVGNMINDFIPDATIVRFKSTI